MNKNIALRGILFLGMPGRKGFPFRATNKYIWYTGRDNGFASANPQRWASPQKIQSKLWIFIRLLQRPNPTGSHPFPRFITENIQTKVWVFSVVHREGFEPTTPCSEDKCSNPLSYRCMEQL